MTRAKAAIAVADALLDLQPAIARKAHDHLGQILSPEWARLAILIREYEDAVVREILDPPPNRAKPKRKKPGKNHP